jgi:hypothetical protein
MTWTLICEREKDFKGNRVYSSDSLKKGVNIEYLNLYLTDGIKKSEK